MPNLPSNCEPVIKVNPDLTQVTPTTVEVWVLDMGTVDQIGFNHLIQYLGPTEQIQCQRIKHPQTQRNFGVGRGCLRYLLGHALKQAPATLQLTVGPHGKPALAYPSDLHFNLSHAGDYLAIALSHYHPLGIDIEQERTIANLSGLCRRCLTPAEAKTVLSLPTDQAHRQFLRHWTCKEAYVKGLGLGLTMPLTELDLGLDPEVTALTPTLLTHPRGVAQGWQIFQWQHPSGYLAALAVDQSGHPQLPILSLNHTTPSDLLLAMP